MAASVKEDREVGVVVVTHKEAADCMVAAAGAIVGTIPALQSVCVAVAEPFGAMVEKIAQACEAVDEGMGYLILVDLHGSTPFNAAMVMLDGTQPAEVLCGVNLPMLIKLATMDRRGRTPADLAEELRISARRSIRLGSELTGRIAIKEVH